MNFKNLFKVLTVVLVGTLVFTSCEKDIGKQTTGGEYALVGNCKKSDMSGMPLVLKSEASLELFTQITASKLSRSGTHIAGVRVYIPNKCTDFSVFAGENADSPAQTKAAEWQEAGWQYVLFDEPIQVGDANIVIGCKYKGNSFAVESISSSKDEISIDGEKVALSELTSQVVGNTVFCMQAIMKGGDYSSKTQIDMAIDHAGVDKTWYMQGDVVKGSILVRNNGVKSISGVKVNATLGAENMAFTIDDELLNGQSRLFSFEISANGSGSQDLKVETVAEGDESTKNSSATANLRVYTDAGMTRNTVLLEQFTTMKCPNCPRGTKSILAAIEGMDDPDKVSWVAHHVGYYTDELTLNESEAMLTPLEVSGAPGGSLNRMLLNLDGTLSLSWVLDYATTDVLNSLAAEPAQSTLKLERTYNAETKAVDLTVSGKSLEKETYVTVILTQNGLEGTQSGASGTYTHNYVPRMFFTAAAGDKVEVDADGNFSVKFSEAIPETVGNFQTVAEDMQIVAFVHGNLKASNSGERYVYNADKVSLVEGAAAGMPSFNFSQEEEPSLRMLAPQMCIAE